MKVSLDGRTREAIREVLEFAGYKTAADRTAYWERMRKNPTGSHWSDKDEARLAKEPDPPPSTPVSTPIK